MTYAAYLTAEEGSPTRHEYIDGVIVAMAGGSDEHNAIANKLMVLSGSRLSGNCRSYSPDQRFWIAATGRARYSDGSIICGKPEHPPHDGQATTKATSGSTFNRSTPCRHTWSLHRTSVA